MNKHVKDLWRLCVLETSADFNPMNFQAAADKFAELIIKECFAVIEKNMPEFTCKEDYDNLYRKAGRLDAIEEIQNHFGVE